MQFKFMKTSISLFKIISFIICFSFSISCHKDIKKKSSAKTQQKAAKKIDSIQSKKTKHIVLNDKNAMEFFLEYDKNHKENKVRLYTDFGNIDILLFNETKFHRSNFIYLTKKGYFDYTQFFRVVKNFIIQGGGSDDFKVAKKRKHIGRYLLPVDNRHGFKHHRGVVSMPSSDIDNPYKLATPYQFFITQSNQYHLDGHYTIFGKVIKGMEVVDKICNLETDESEWPLQNVYIKKAEIIE